MFPETRGDVNKRFEQFSEIRPIDDCHLGKILTDIFCYYSNRIIQLEMSSNPNPLSAHQKQKGESLNLARMNSYNEPENYSNIFENIVDAFEFQFESIQAVFEKSEATSYEKDYQYHKQN